MLVAGGTTDWAQVAVTALVGAAGAFVGLSIHLKRRQEVAVTVAQKRFAAYSALWQLIPYSPEVQRLRDLPALTRDQRTALFDSLTVWYYGDGNGMLLGPDTRELYLTVKKNLLCDPDEFVPESLRGRIGTDAERSAVCIRQLSLLRSAMRADLEIFGRPWGKPLDESDRALLRACHVRSWRLLHTRRERLRERLHARQAAPDAQAALDA